MNNKLHSEIESIKHRTIGNIALNLVELLGKSNPDTANTKHIDFNKFRNRASKNAKGILNKQ